LHLPAARATLSQSQVFIFRKASLSKDPAQRGNQAR
jgi:hypothetical protein